MVHNMLYYFLHFRRESKADDATCNHESFIEIMDMIEAWLNMLCYVKNDNLCVFHASLMYLTNVHCNFLALNVHNYTDSGDWFNWHNLYTGLNQIGIIKLATQNKLWIRI